MTVNQIKPLLNAEGWTGAKLHYYFVPITIIYKVSTKPFSKTVLGDSLVLLQGDLKGMGPVS